MTIQVVLLDIRGYILDYKDFRALDNAEIAQFITSALNKSDVAKIELKKWKAVQ